MSNNCGQFSFINLFWLCLHRKLCACNIVVNNRNFIRKFSAENMSDGKETKCLCAPANILIIIVSFIAETVIQRRLLIDGDGTGDDRRLNVLLRSFIKWSNTSDTQENT